MSESIARPPAVARGGNAVSLPLRLNARRFWLWSIALAVMSGIAVVGAPSNRWVDFPQFWFAAHLVGSPDLLEPARQAAWEIARGFSENPPQFLYPPGTAWLYAPLSLLPLAAAFWVHAAVILAIGIASGLVGARAFGLDVRVSLVAALAWTPLLAGAAVGQNAPLGALFALVAIMALRRDRQFVAGLAVGAMLYKPTLAVPLLALLVLRRRWTALAAVVPVAVAWYLAGVAATAGDWLWPAHWLAAIAPYMAADTSQNVDLTVALPGLLIGHGLPSVLGYGAGLAVLVAALPRLLRAPIVEAAAAACLLGIVVSPHSLQYEAVMLLPLLLWSAGGTGTGIAEPWRTRLLVAAYLAAELYVIAPVVGFSVLATLTLGAAAVWITGWQRLDAPAGELSSNAVPAAAALRAGG